MMTDWEKQYLNEDTPWDKGEPAPPLAEFFESNKIEGKVLVPGCGRGHDVRYLASQGLDVVGLDISPTAIEAAQSVGRVADETFVAGDLFALPHAFHGSFDWVFEHTCFCAIHPSQREDYVRAVAQALKPGGQLLAIFYIIVDDADPEHPPFPVSPHEVDQYFHLYFETVQSWVPKKAFPGRLGGKEQMRVLKLKY